MVIYAWKCPECLINEDTTSLTPWDCPSCGLPMRRDYSSVHLGVPDTFHFEPHWNASVGQVVHSLADFKSKLSEGEAKTFAATGRESTLRYVDPRDLTPMTNEGIEARQKLLHDKPSELNRVINDLNR